MCSPFSAHNWRRASSDLSSRTLLPNRRPSTQINRSTYLENIPENDGQDESFKAFTSMDGIISLARRQRQDKNSLFHKTKSLYKANCGLILTTISGIFFASASLFVKLSNTTIPAFEIIFVRMVIQTVFVIPPSIYKRTNLLGPKKQRPYLVIFGAINFACISSIYGAFTLLPLGDATVIISTTPVFAAIMAYFALKEAWHKHDAVSTFSCLAGIVLITRPTFIFGHESNQGHVNNTHRLIGYAVALFGAIIQSTTFIIVRGFGNSISFFTSVFYFGWCSAILSCFSMFIFQSPVLPDCGSTRWYLLLVAVFGVMGSLCLNRGLQMENAAPAALMRNVDILFAFVFDVECFHAQPSSLTILGAAIVCLSTTGAVVLKWYRSRDSPNA